LTGLGNDDHPQYLLTNGTRPMAGDLNMEDNSITNLNQLNGGTPWTSANDGAGSTLDADLLDGQDVSAFASSTHNHNDSYYTETELNTSDGDAPNSGSNLMHWDNLNGVPAGFTDGVDNEGGVTDHGALTGLGNDDHPQYLLTNGTRPMAGNLDMGNNQITNLNQLNGGTPWTSANDGAGSTLDADLLDGQHSSAFASSIHNHNDTYYPKTELNTSDGDAPNIGSNRMHWDNLNGVPAGFADGVDNEGAAGVTDHGALTGLGDDDHTQYGLLAGRSGGQTLRGSNAASENLTLDSTSHSTKGNVLLNPSGGKVGIGTTSPEFRLSIDNDGGILAKGAQGSGATLTTSGAGTRLIWYPRKAAFRAGIVGGSEWDDANIGPYSTAMGGGSIASGNNSTAMGINTTASGQYSTAMGGGSIASGHYSTAMGFSTTASGNSSTAMGDNTTASGQYSTAMGRLVTAQAYCSIVLGEGLDYNNRLINNTPDSLIVGFNSNTTLFVDSDQVGIMTSSPATGFELDVNGDIRCVSLTQTSSLRFKEDIREIDKPLERVMSLRGVYFNWKDSNKQDIGLIAEEVGRVIPEVVTYEENGVDAIGLDYARLVALLIEAVKEQQKRIEFLEGEMAKLIRR
ncbi:MAG: tail fiber domain-containing protein, partial [bacterium]